VHIKIRVVIYNFSKIGKQIKFGLNYRITKVIFSKTKMKGQISNIIIKITLVLHLNYFDFSIKIYVKII
jgi:hypothetical protein